MLIHRPCGLILTLALASASGQLNPAATWATTAASSFQVQSNLTYLTVNGHESKLDVFRRRGPGAPEPTLIYIHGGGWTSGHKEDGLMYTLPWLEMGWNVVNVEYRLADVAPAPGAVEDCLCALRWIVGHAAAYRIDPARLVVMGDSSGGHLALMTGMAPAASGLDRPCNPSRDSAAPKVAGIVNWYGITDVTDLLQGPNKRGFAVDWLAKSENREETAKRVSPVTWARADLPPIITIHGDSDPTVPYSQAVKLRDALNAVHARNEFITIPGGKHGGFSADERVRAYLTIRNFLAAYGLPTAFDDTPAPAFETLTVVKDSKTPPLMNTLNLVAEGAGFYKEQHLKVTTIASDGPVDARRICSSGQGDICPVGIEPLVAPPPAGGVQLKMFLSRMSKFGYVIGVPENSPIRTPADLKGRKIGVHSATGASATFASESTLAAAGLKPTDYQLVTIGLDDKALAALTSGEVAAAALPYYEMLPFVVAGTKLRIFRHPTLGEVPNSGYAAAPSVIAAKGDALRHFSRAIVEASLLIRYNPAAAARAMLVADGKPFGDAELQRRTAELTAWEDDLPAADSNNRRIGAISESGTQAYIQLMAQAGAIKAPIPASQVLTDEFIAFANDFDHEAVRRLAATLPTR